MKWLSICIPTYNRSSLLAECLRSILASIKGREREVEVVILDNASSDGTQDMLAPFLRRYPLIRYIRNAETVEANRNIYAAGLQGAGEYVWVFGDDDIMEPEAVGHVFSAISEECNLIVCNYSMWSKDMLTLIKGRCLPMTEDRNVSDHDALLSLLGPKLAFISAVVCKRDVLRRLPAEEFERYREYGFAFLYALYFGVMNNCAAKLIAALLVKQRGDNSSSDTATWYRYFGAGTSLVIDALAWHGYDRTSVRAAKNIVLRDFIMHDISFRKRERIAMTGVATLLFRHFRTFPFFWLVCLPGILMPSALARLIHAAAFFLRPKTDPSAAGAKG